jgi:hypothetical protein
MKEMGRKSISDASLEKVYNNQQVKKEKIK